jgi:hypothetical protein
MDRKHLPLGWVYEYSYPRGQIDPAAVLSDKNNEGQWLVYDQDKWLLPSQQPDYELSFSINCSAGEKRWCRIIKVLSRVVSPDDARIMAMTTNW